MPPTCGEHELFIVPNPGNFFTADCGTHRHAILLPTLSLPQFNHSGSGGHKASNVSSLPIRTPSQHAPTPRLAGSFSYQSSFLLEHFNIAVDGGDAHTETLACLENGARRLFLEHAQQQLTPLAGAYPSAGGSIPILLRRQTTLAPIAPRGHAAFVRKIPRGVSELLFLVLAGANWRMNGQSPLIRSLLMLYWT